MVTRANRRTKTRKRNEYEHEILKHVKVACVVRVRVCACVCVYSPDGLRTTGSGWYHPLLPPTSAIFLSFLLLLRSTRNHQATNGISSYFTLFISTMFEYQDEKKGDFHRYKSIIHLVLVFVIFIFPR